MQFVASAGLIPASARSLPAMRLARPRSIAQAMEALGDAEFPVLLAGGTDLVASFNEGLRPREIVSLAGVEELRAVQGSPSGLRIGACVTHGEGSTHPALLAQAPGLALAWSTIANPRIRFSATIGGNLMARRFRYEGSLLLAAAKAQLEFATGKGTQRCTPQQLWAGAVAERSLLVAIDVETAGLLAYFYDRSMRPLLTLAAGIRRNADGLLLTCAVATEYLQPVLLETTLRGADLPRLARDAKAIAQEVFTQLPGNFADPVLTHAYARTAGAVLLARRLAEVADD